MSEGGDRRRVYGFRAERQANFAKNVRKAYLDEGRRQKDSERARMEAYRKLCAREGIQSERLAEYDRARAEASRQLGQALEAVDYDQSLTNNEKKRRKYNLKRKFAATTVNELLDKRQKRHTAITDVEATQEKRAAAREEKQRQRAEREQARERHVQERRQRSALYAKRTKRGQPVLATRVQSLLRKLDQS